MAKSSSNKGKRCNVCKKRYKHDKPTTLAVGCHEASLYHLNAAKTLAADTSRQSLMSSFMTKLPSKKGTGAIEGGDDSVIANQSIISLIESMGGDEDTTTNTNGAASLRSLVEGKGDEESFSTEKIVAGAPRAEEMTIGLELFGPGLNLIYVPKVHNGVIGFNNPIIPAMMWISFILTAGTSENE